MVVLLSCGGGSNLSPEEYREDSHVVVCEYYARCGAFADYAECTAYFDFKPLAPDALAALEDGSLLFDSDAAADCLEAIENLSCRLANFYESQPTCDATWTGALGNGATCHWSYQCASDHCGTPSDCTLACCAGSCIDLPATGESCPDGDCADRLYCDFLGDGTCKSLKALSEPCDYWFECNYDYTCKSTDGLPNRCLPRAEAGESCADGLSGSPCAEWSQTCNPVSLICEQFRYRGDTCDPQEDLCSVYSSWCDPATTICAELPGPGSPCDGNRGCRPGAYCDTTAVCVAERAVGDACALHRECATEYCNASTLMCEPRPNCIVPEAEAARQSDDVVYSIGTWSAQRR